MLSFAADPTVFHNEDSIQTKPIDICFIGTAWDSRIKFIDRLSKYIDTNKLMIIGPGWEKLKRYPKLKDQIINKPLSMEETRGYLVKSKIVLNKHRKHNEITKNYNDHLKLFNYCPLSFYLAVKRLIF
ncbi:hypothetical protein LC087_14655 [Bacillus carboniphilus]|uniref:Uncharacterized protein n=1 Tax=Bacillus carboniphilus TaxID=86663 RepID=A0ABY9JUB4_9BACI|nr:hypothetical protein [Bacillus carboniphilus]WLR42017.1 hypothetical protein LC087_14655 [Bacillus carboniphilus]